MILIAWILNALVLMAVAAWVPGFEVASFYSALIAALILGLVNALLKPLLIILTLPINVVTLGLFTFVINAFMLMLVSSIVKGFDIDSFGTALIGALVMALLGWAINLIKSPVR